jgi:hypothetical protein
MTKQEAFDAVNSFILKNGGRYSEWYVGIASDPRDRLFNKHYIKETTDLWIYCPCEKSVDARNVERHFVEKLGALGGQGGGDYNTIYVYAYKTASHTLETA